MSMLYTGLSYGFSIQCIAPAGIGHEAQAAVLIQVGVKGVHLVIHMEVAFSPQNHHGLLIVVLVGAGHMAGWITPMLMV